MKKFCECDSGVKYIKLRFPERSRKVIMLQNLLNNENRALLQRQSLEINWKVSGQQNNFILDKMQTGTYLEMDGNKRIFCWFNEFTSRTIIDQLVQHFAYRGIPHRQNVATSSSNGLVWLCFSILHQGEGHIFPHTVLYDTTCDSTI